MGTRQLQIDARRSMPPEAAGPVAICATPEGCEPWRGPEPPTLPGALTLMTRDQGALAVRAEHEPVWRPSPAVTQVPVCRGTTVAPHPPALPSLRGTAVETSL